MVCLSEEVNSMSSYPDILATSPQQIPIILNDYNESVIKAAYFTFIPGMLIIVTTEPLPQCIS